ncbi:hypothetical protein KAW64_14045, partial [bacterium]|nr:hypothetical protein [bacterium]
MVSGTVSGRCGCRSIRRSGGLLRRRGIRRSAWRSRSPQDGELAPHGLAAGRKLAEVDAASDGP